MDQEAIDGLVDELIDYGVWRMPVPVMEDLIEVGGAAVEPLARVLREVAHEEMEYPATWSAIVVGQLRAPAAAPALVDAILTAPGEFVPVRVAAAEALAAIGEPALPELRRLGASSNPHDRLWSCYATGLIGGRAAFEFLVSSLEADPDMADVVALALSDLGDAAAIEPLHRALGPAEPWQRTDIEGAIQFLHNGSSPRSPARVNWRVRYRLNRWLGRYPATWATVLATTRDLPKRRAVTRDLRPLEEILSEPVDLDVEERCECCDVPTWRGPGVPVCPKTAVAIPILMADQFGRLRDEAETDDIFEALDDAESRLVELAVREPRTRRARERHVDEDDRLRLMLAGLIWAVENGADTLAAASAMLLAHAGRANAEHGDPMGVLTPVRRPARSMRRAGRNDPCPCGSGRKYKKCCGPLDATGADIGPSADVSPAIPNGMPTTFNFDDEPVVFSHAHYQITDHDLLLRALRECDELEQGEEPGIFIWFKELGDDFRRLLGRIDAASPDRLVLECMSQERLERGRRLLERIAGESLSHRMDTAQDPWQAAAHLPPRQRSPADEVPPEIAGPVIRNFLDSHYSTWPDDPLPALDGRTAREAVRTPAGRRKVTALLRTFEEAEHRRPPEMRYDFGWIREELGLDRPPGNAS
jgi:hypothetical protein